MRTRWVIGDVAMVLCPDSERRGATLTGPGFVWVTHDGAFTLFAEGGYDPQPVVREAGK